MNRERALKVVLVMVVFVRIEPSLSMMFSLYVTLGVFLLLAVRDPAGNRSVIGFTAWSSLVHAVWMGMQAFQGMVSRDELVGVAVLVVIGVALIGVAPGKRGVERVRAAVAR